MQLFGGPARASCTAVNASNTPQNTSCLASCLAIALPACPLPAPCLQVLEYIEDSMPPESAAAFGLHPNAEIGFKLREASAFCSNLQTLQVGGWVGGWVRDQGWQGGGIPSNRTCFSSC